MHRSPANNCFQYTAYFAVSTNLVNYLKDQLHVGSKAAANGVTNWLGTSSITPLVAAFLADAFLGRYWTIALFLLISVVAYAVLTASAAAALESAAFYAGLYLLALGGALQPVLVAFGADQFDGADEVGRALQSSFFNWFYLSINVGSLVGGTVLVWVQSSVSWGLGYGIPAMCSVLAVAVFLAGTAAYRRHQRPGGSPLTRVAQVVVAAVGKCGVEAPEDASELHECEGDDGMSAAIQGSRCLAHTDQFRFLDKAAVETAGDKPRPSPWRLCTVTQVEELKCVLRLLPVWASGIIFAAAYTQMTTTFILQGDTMDPYIGNFRVPAAVLSVFDTISVMLWVPLYDRLIVPLARRATGHERGFTQLARMGVGLVVLAAAMVAAGTLEVERRRVIARHGMYDTNTGADGKYLPLSIFWQVPQYVVVGASEVFTFIGQMEFFYDQAPDAMRSLCSGLSMTSFALGNYVSSALVTVVARATARGGRDGWIPDDINRGHLDNFFWLLAMMCMGNFGVYLLIARWYTYKKTVDKAAANSVTNWQGTTSVMALVAAFLADAFLGRYWTTVLFMLISVVAYAVPTVSAAAAAPSAALFYTGLYILALGGALQPVVTSFGADQFDDSDEEGRRRQSSFFNWFYQSLNVGSLVGGTVLVWVQTNVSWGLGYGIPAMCSVLAVAVFLAGTTAYRRHQPPAGSPITRVAQVVVAAARKWRVEAPDDASELHECEGDDGMSAIQGSRRLAHTDQFRFLDKAAVETERDKAQPSPWRLCTVTQVEELKCVLRLLPVLASGIIFAAAYAQMSSTFILQGDTLDPYVAGFRVPAAVISIFETISVMLWVPLYDRLVVPLVRRATGHERGFTQLARMGVGLAVLAVAMVAAGTLEVERRRVIERHGMYDTNTGDDGAYLPLSVFWQVPQYVVVGAAEVFTLIGQLEFFYDQAPDAMRSLCSGLSTVSFALGNYLSSALVTIVARATARGGRDGWIPDEINRGHLDNFFWLLAVLCVGNLGVYLLIARWYTYKKTVD
ncbi:hypothetical protein HU200_011274 [Digitaria exilis]|uniref:Peptide transporter n=1 Tax=Digitaria exilis TaxID=1010633 RepID=A0A835FH10_9POAL|nr:hypothetical protein HU200_011274 [Digitaria exilis]